MNSKMRLLLFAVFFYSTTLFCHTKEERLAEINRINSADHWFEILEVKKTATESDIKKVFVLKCLLVHPDKYSSEYPDLIKSGNEAFQKLSNAQKVRADEAFAVAEKKAGNERKNRQDEAEARRKKAQEDFESSLKKAQEDLKKARERAENSQNERAKKAQSERQKEMNDYINRMKKEREEREKRWESERAEAKASFEAEQAKRKEGREAEKQRAAKRAANWKEESDKWVKEREKRKHRQNIIFYSAIFCSLIITRIMVRIMVRKSCNYIIKK